MLERHLVTISHYNQSLSSEQAIQTYDSILPQLIEIVDWNLKKNFFQMNALVQNYLG